MASYTAVFYIFTFKKSSLLKQVFVTITFILLVVGYVAVEDNNALLLSRLGKYKQKYFVLKKIYLMCSFIKIINKKNSKIQD